MQDIFFGIDEWLDFGCWIKFYMILMFVLVGYGFV